MSVPLLVKLPHARSGSVSDRNVESIDLVPTVAEVLEVELPWEADGSSVLQSSDERPTKTVVGLDGEALKTCKADFPEKTAAVERTLDAFGRYPGVEGLFRIGPHQELIGRRISECEVAVERAGETELFGTEILARADAAAAWVPCHLGGRIITFDSARLPMDLAIAVDGKVLATTRTLTIPGLEETWTAMVPEEAFGGSREVEVYAIRSSNGKVRLFPLNVVSSAATP